MACRRCHGFLVGEILQDTPASVAATVRVLRCLNCGHVEFEDQVSVVKRRTGNRAA